MSKFKGKTVLVTGGASGLGRLMGQMALQRGASRLVIWDINLALLEETLQELKSQGYSAWGAIVDVSNTEQVIKSSQDLIDEVGQIDFLFNNAGIIVGKNFAEHSHLEIDRTLQINLSSLMHITLAFLPSMMKKNSGHIINISSAASLLANPKMSVYCASKWGVTGWSESLCLELQETHPGMKVTTVKPFYINTGMFAGVSSPIVPILKPEVAARIIMNAVENNRTSIAFPWIVNLLPFVKAILPSRWFDLLVGKWFGIYHTMDAFKGR